MRSHFRADFYAKALALFALGGLAAAGVAIDNWPTATRMPDLAFGPPQLRTPVVQTFEEVAALSYSSIDVIPVTGGSRRIAARPLPKLPKARWSASFRRTIPAVRPIEPMPQPTPVESLVVILPNPVLELSAAPELDTAVDAETWQPLQASAIVAHAEEVGFFSGAIRKTSASLDKAKTSVVDAVRAVGGAVRIFRK